MKQCTLCATSHDRPQETCSKSCSLKASNRRKFPGIRKTCVTCGADFEVEFIRRDNVTCSRRCAKALADRSVDRAAVGRKISEARLRHAVEGLITYPGNPWSQKTRERLLTKFRDGRRKGPGNSMFGRRHREESKDAMSETRSRKIATGEYDRSRWARKGEVFAAKANRTIPYRSSWELRAVELLEADPAVTSFRFEPFRVPFVYQAQSDPVERKRHYVPDFLVEYRDGRRVVVEVKPRCYVDTMVNRAKAHAAREYAEEIGASFEFWTQERLWP